MSKPIEVDQACQCGTKLTGWRLPPGGIERAIKRKPHVWAANRADAARGWGWLPDRPAHDVLTGGAAADILAYGTCRTSEAPHA